MPYKIPICERDAAPAAPRELLRGLPKRRQKRKKTKKTTVETNNRKTYGHALQHLHLRATGAPGAQKSRKPNIQKKQPFPCFRFRWTDSVLLVHTNAGFRCKLPPPDPRQLLRGPPKQKRTPKTQKRHSRRKTIEKHMAMPDKISNCNRQGAPGPKNPGNPKLKKNDSISHCFRNQTASK